MLELLNQLKNLQRNEGIKRLHQLKSRFKSITLNKFVSEKESVKFRELYNNKLCMFYKTKNV